MTAGVTRLDTRAPGRRGAPPAADPAPLVLVVLVAVLCVIGLVMVLSASSVQALRQFGGAWLFFERQLMWVALGSVALAGAALVDYRRWQALARALLVVSVALLVLVLVPGVGLAASGSTRWLGFGWVRVQPSELAKLALLVFAADLLTRRSSAMHDRRATLWPVLLVTGFSAGLVLLQPDMGTAVVLVSVVLVVLFVAGVALPAMAAVVAAALAGAVTVGLAAGYRRDRLFAFLHPWKDPTNTGYQIAQSLVALGTGHVTGIGLGASRAKWGFLPNAHTDFIFAIVGEELGLFGTLLVVGLFVVFAALGVRTALRAPDRFGTLVAAGVTGWILVQALVNVGAVIGILPVTGVPLPFVSFGGSSLVISMAAVGVLVNIARQVDR